MRDLHVTLGGHEILKGVDAELMHNSITAVIGLNGSGKTTLLRALVKEVPYTGEMTFHCGHDHRRPSPEHVGYVPQKLNVDAYLPLTVYDLFGIALQRWRPLFLGVRRSVRERARALLEQVGAADLLHSRFEALSGGERQRVLLALALDPSPELLLLDEPAAGIDFKDVDKFYELIKALNQRLGVTVLLVSHDVTVVRRLVDHVLCLRDGRIQCQGPPQQIITDQVLADTFGTSLAVYPHHH
jgi:zinc transport system ATP-binding protein